MNLGVNDILLLMVRDITERKEMEKKLLNSVIDTEEKERQYFSQELHDGLGPLLSAAKMYVEWLSEPNSDAPRESTIADIKKLLEEAGNTTREISYKLSPHVLQNYGLIEALKNFISRVEKTGKIHIFLEANNVFRLDDKFEIIIYRIITECINNAIKYANAQNIKIKVAIIDHLLTAHCEDDGEGFEIGKSSVQLQGQGLLNMQSRLKSLNGYFTIDSLIGRGTVVVIKVPINKTI